MSAENLLLYIYIYIKRFLYNRYVYLYLSSRLYECQRVNTSHSI